LFNLKNIITLFDITNGAVENGIYK